VLPPPHTHFDTTQQEDDPATAGYLVVDFRWYHHSGYRYSVRGFLSTDAIADLAPTQTAGYICFAAASTWAAHLFYVDYLQSLFRCLHYCPPTIDELFLIMLRTLRMLSCLDQ